ncbi:Integrase catalytic domain-containing protein [Mycena indigotica]|uniref:Integrase catalytic domain-containing protein n=1 Tax=Mycena indigotica TaxID=2126181 RepID=A0A8H6SVI1_9AGAR|nr:Integrase catalytic domain-containing protein [Mycena indigotica]KAF7306246.1 Integrase catalytic domain-containing protein [Mycena indigotica]
MESLPHEFPALPAHFDNGIWPPSVLQAHDIVHDAYRYAYEALNAGDNESHRLKLHADKILNCTLPIVRAMELEILNPQWIEEAEVLVAALGVALEASAAAMETVNVDHLKKPVLVKIQRGRRGRPRKIISQDWLTAAVAPGRRLTLTKLAELAGVHRHTLRAYMKSFGVYERFNQLSDHDLDLLVRTFKSKKPSSGLSYIVGFLRRHGVKVQRRRVRAAIRRIDPLGTAIRRHEATDRQKYRVPNSNYLWHLDGHHKLIRWGVVIHGIVDGYCRTITALEASTNNEAQTVLNLFLSAINRFHVVPSRMRGDRGGENIEVAVWMIKHRGARRASFMWGSSTRNTRIERLWVEVGTQFARRWRAFFTRLERLHGLNHTSPRHLWLLHQLFLDEINDDCREFSDEWNLHPLKGNGNKGQSPLDIRFVSETCHGVDEDQPGIHPTVLEEFYGVVEDTDEEWQDIDDIIANDQHHDIRHDPIAVPTHEAPFDNAIQQLFFQALALKQQEGVTAETDFDVDTYEICESIRLGRAGKKVSIQLPAVNWWPRTLLWTQALDLMTAFCIELGIE